jgi:hypothetical protein
VNERREEYERLSHAFAVRRPSHGCNDCPDPEQLFEAASGDLAREQRMQIIDHVAQCAECTEAWRLATQLGARPAQRAAEPSAAASSPLPRADRMPLRRIAFAASAVLAVGVVTYLALPVDDGIPQYRDAAEPLAPTAQVAGSLPRDRFLLRWTPGPQGSSYSVRLSTADLTPLLMQQDIARPELLVPTSMLANVKSGDPLLWQVEVRLPDGRRIASETYVVTMQ